MKTLSTILIELQAVIEQTAQLIEGCEGVMAQGGPVIDLESQRVRLFHLRHIERVVSGVAKARDTRNRNSRSSFTHGAQCRVAQSNLTLIQALVQVPTVEIPETHHHDVEATTPANTNSHANPIRTRHKRP